MSRREYKGAATPTTLAATITNSATSLTITDATNWPTGSFSLVIDPGLAGEEKVLATSRTGTTVTLTTRGYDNTSASSHVSGAVIYPVPTAIDFDEANSHVNASTGVHGLTGAVVGTTDTQTLSAKTLTSPVISTIVNTGTLTLPTTTGTVALTSDITVTASSTTTFTNKTLTTPIITQGTSTPSFTTNAYTIVSSDAGLFLLASNSSTAGTINIPTDATWAAPNGTQIHIQQTGSGQLTIQAATSGTTTVVSNGATAAAPKIRAQYSVATIMKTSTNNWTVYGDIA